MTNSSIESSNRQGHYAQFGCGLCAPDSWLNFDVSPALRLQKLPIVGRLAVGKFGAFPKNVRVGDVVRGLPVEPSSCVAVYSSHVLEHLSLSDLRIALNNVFDLLKPGGTFRFVMPDLEWLAKTYLQQLEDRTTSSNSWFMQESYLGVEHRPRGIRGLMRSWLGNSSHLWMWDLPGISAELEAVGFTGIRRAKFGDSSDDMFTLVESEERWTNALGVECSKPL